MNTRVSGCEVAGLFRDNGFKIDYGEIDILIWQGPTSVAPSPLRLLSFYAIPLMWGMCKGYRFARWEIEVGKLRLENRSYFSPLKER